MNASASSCQHQFSKNWLQLDCIQRHTIDAGYRAHFHLRQHMVIPVTKFVEQVGHFVVGKQRRLIANWAVEVTRQVSHWCLRCATVGSATHTTLIHPRATAFVFTRLHFEIEAATQRPSASKYQKSAPFRAIHLPVALFDLHAKQTAQHFKQAIHHFCSGKKGRSSSSEISNRCCFCFSL